MDVRGASLREALTRLFYATNVSFVFEGNIPSGVVTAKMKNQTFETALRLLLDASDTPLTYQRTGKVYLISVAPTRKTNPNVSIAENIVQQLDMPAETNGNGVPENNATIATGYNFTPAPTGGFQEGANGLILNPSGNDTGRTFGPLFGQPLGFPPAIYANPSGFGYPTIYNNTGGFWAIPPVNSWYGGSGFYFITR